MTEKEVQILETAGNMMRGMSLDPRIPAECRDLLLQQALKVESVAEAHVYDEDDK